MTDLLRLAHFRAATESLRRDDEAALMTFAFRVPPLFRMGFDRHVRQWDKHMRRRLWRAYWNRPDFKSAYDARVSPFDAFQDCPVGRDVQLISGER